MVLVIALALTLAPGAPASVQAEDGGAAIDFDWSMPDRFGDDMNQDGLVDYPVEKGRPGAYTLVPSFYEVELKVETGSCRPGATYRWTVDGEEEPPVEGRCGHRVRVPAEGAYEVTLERELDGVASRRTKLVTVQDWLIVSIGDSVASGEGNPDVRGNLFHGAKWQDRRCHRSARAGPAVAARLVEEADSRTSVTFWHLACSGATIESGLLGGFAGVDPELEDEPLQPQTSKLMGVAARREVDAVLVSVGANDIHFGPLLTLCARKPRCFRSRFDPVAERRRHGLPALTAEQLVELELRRLPDRYERLAAALAESVRPGRVLITEYFDPTRDADGQYCSRSLLRIRGSEGAWAFDSVLEPLNAAVRTAAHRHLWRPVEGVAEMFRRHGYCAPDEHRWVRRVTESLFQQSGGKLKARILGTFHPNELGHEATGGLIAQQLHDVLLTGALQGGTVPDPESGVSQAERGDGDVIPDNPLEWLAFVMVGVVGVTAASLRGLLKPRLSPSGPPASNRRRLIADPSTEMPFLSRSIGSVLVAAAVAVDDQSVVEGVLALGGLLGLLAPNLVQSLHTRRNGRRASPDAS